MFWNTSLHKITKITSLQKFEIFEQFLMKLKLFLKVFLKILRNFKWTRPQIFVTESTTDVEQLQILQNQLHYTIKRLVCERYLSFCLNFRQKSLKNKKNRFNPKNFMNPKNINSDFGEKFWISENRKINCLI